MASSFAPDELHRRALRVASGAQVVAVVLPLMLPGAFAQSPNDCATDNDDARRLACYDRLFRSRVDVTPPTTTPSPPAANAQDSTLVSKLWELTPATKRGTFVVRTYLPNFLLPLHGGSDINRAPYSPTHPAGEPKTSYRRVEAKLQVSLRAKIVEGLFLPDADLWFAYTQRSLWQVWNSRDSSPFRNTDYQPEAIYVVPVPPAWAALPDGWRWRLVQLGFAHQSNGQSDPLSRSWNRVYAGAAIERGEFGLQLRVIRRLRESEGDDNPDLTRYIGNTELVSSWLPGLATAALIWRTDLRSARRGSLQLDWTYPVNRRKSDGLRWYAQLFTGYGETLLDYNYRQTTLGLGLALFQF